MACEPRAGTDQIMVNVKHRAPLLLHRKGRKSPETQQAVRREIWLTGSSCQDLETMTMNTLGDGCSTWPPVIKRALPVRRPCYSVSKGEIACKTVRGRTYTLEKNEAIAAANTGPGFVQNELDVGRVCGIVVIDAGICQSKTAKCAC